MNVKQLLNISWKNTNKEFFFLVLMLTKNIDYD